MKTFTFRFAAALIIIASASINTANAQTNNNPLAYANDFNVFTKDGLTFQAGDTHGPVATGGNLTLAGATSIALNYNGTFPGAGTYFGLVVGGRIFYSNGNVSYVNHGSLRLGNTTGTTLFDHDNNNAAANLQATSGSFGSNPRVEVQYQQSAASATQGSGINFTNAFNELNYNSGLINQFPITGSCQSNFNYIPAPTTTNPQITLVANKVNYINLTQAQLSNLDNLGSITFLQHPDATHVLIINVTGNGAYTWTTPNWAGLNEGDGAYIIVNFSAVTSLTLTGGSSVYGTVLAPNADVYKTGANNNNGQIVSKTLSVAYGEIHYYPFAGSLPSCTATPYSSVNTNNSAPLAVHAINLTISAENAVAPSLTWSVTGEENMLHYDLEKSTNGNDYTTLTTIMSAGSGNNNYSAQDNESAASANSFYRIRAVGLDGTFQYSNTVQYRGKVVAGSVSVWPSPFTDIINIKAGEGFEAGAIVQISDMSGRMLITKSFPAGTDVLNITEASNLQNGLYLLHVADLNGNTRSAMRIVKGQ